MNYFNSRRLLGCSSLSFIFTTMFLRWTCNKTRKIHERVLNCGLKTYAELNLHNLRLNGLLFSKVVDNTVCAELKKNNTHKVVVNIFYNKPWPIHFPLNFSVKQTTNKQHNTICNSSKKITRTFFWVSNHDGCLLLKCHPSFKFNQSKIVK